MNRIYHVPGRDWREYADDGIALNLPDGDKVDLKDRVVLFDRDFEFTQHDVIQGGDKRVVVGPAKPWPRKASA